MDWDHFYAVTMDTHGAVNPRGRQLVNKLAVMAERKLVERGAAPKRWWQIADATITSMSTALQRGVAKRILLAHEWCHREAQRHSQPSGAFGAPVTDFAAVNEKPTRPRLVPGATWADRAKPLKKVVKRGPTLKTKAKKAAKAAAARAGLSLIHI